MFVRSPGSANRISQYAVDAWRIHTGLDEAPAGWKDPYARLDKSKKKAIAKKRTTAKKK